MKKYHFFWNGPFSNWDPSEFTIGDKTFSCAEQYMMYWKAMTMGDIETAHKVMQTKSPREQKALGRQIQNFDADLWTKDSFDIMLPGLIQKFLQNPEHMAALKATGDAEIVEASPEDRIWGIGYFENDALENIDNWGENRLGKLLMKVRDIIF